MSSAMFNRRTAMRSVAAAGLCGLAAPLPLRFAAAADAKTVSAVSLSANTNRVFDEILAQQGFLEEYGINPNTVYVSDGTKVVAALVSGSGDVCMQLGFAGVIPAILAGAKLKVIAGSGILPELAVYSAKPEIQSVSDLVGRSVGVGALGTHLHLLMVTLLRKKGIDHTRVQFVSIGTSSDVFRAVIAGKVDAGPGDLAFYGNPQKHGVRALRDGALWAEIPEYVNQISMATDAAIEQRGELIVRMLAAYRKLYRFIHDPKSQEPWRRAFLKVLNSGEEEAATQWNHYQKHRPFAEDLIVAEPRVRYMQDLNLMLGTQKALLDYNQIVNTSLAREAMKLAV